jgi:hypothetical protein
MFTQHSERLNEQLQAKWKTSLEQTRSTHRLRSCDRLSGNVPVSELNDRSTKLQCHSTTAEGEGDSVEQRQTPHWPSTHCHDMCGDTYVSLVSAEMSWGMVPASLTRSEVNASRLRHRPPPGRQATTALTRPSTNEHKKAR